MNLFSLTELRHEQFTFLPLNQSQHPQFHLVTIDYQTHAIWPWLLLVIDVVTYGGSMLWLRLIMYVPWVCTWGKGKTPEVRCIRARTTSTLGRHQKMPTPQAQPGRHNWEKSSISSTPPTWNPQPCGSPTKFRTSPTFSSSLFLFFIFLISGNSRNQLKPSPTQPTSRRPRERKAYRNGHFYLLLPNTQNGRRRSSREARVDHQHNKWVRTVQSRSCRCAWGLSTATVWGEIRRLQCEPDVIETVSFLFFLYISVFYTA